MKVWAISDVHTDYRANMEWAQGIASGGPRSDDVLVVAGDVAHDMDTIEATLRAFRSAYGSVFYTVGNHELWLTKKDRDAGVTDSVAKLGAVQAMCDRIGVDTRPRRLPGGVWIVPLLSW